MSSNLSMFRVAAVSCVLGAWSSQQLSFLHLKKLIIIFKNIAHSEMCLRLRQHSHTLNRSILKTQNANITQLTCLPEWLEEIRPEVPSSTSRRAGKLTLPNISSGVALRLQRTKYYIKLNTYL